MKEVKILKISKNAKTPTKGTVGSSCYDLYSSEEITLQPHTTKMVATGLKVQFDPEYELQIRPRSSLQKLGLIIPNSPGTVDSDYRGEIKVLLHNLSDLYVLISVGDRIAQMKVSSVPEVELVEVSQLDETERGEGGFGSTGK